MKFEKDGWLSEMFAYDVFKAGLAPAEEIESQTAFASLSKSGRMFCYTKIPVTSVAQVAALTRAGFRVVDVNVTFSRAPQSISSNESIVVRDALEGDEDTVLRIAETAFTFSRFHLDPCVPREVANRIKREWIANYFRGKRGERLLVAEVSGKPVGFLALLVAHEHTGVIDLIAVDRQQQGRGVGARLVEYHICDSAGKYSELIVGTQIANIPSMRLYTKCGYVASGAAYVLHAHLIDGGVMQ